MNKKYAHMAILGGALVVSAQAYAAAGCTSGTASSIAGGGTTGTLFVKTGFTPKCSANITVNVTDGGSDFSVSSASAKGKTVFGGSTMGGQVSACTVVASGSPTAASAPNITTGC